MSRTIAIVHSILCILAKGGPAITRCADSCGNCHTVIERIGGRGKARAAENCVCRRDAESQRASRLHKTSIAFTFSKGFTHLGERGRNRGSCSHWKNSASLFLCGKKAVLCGLGFLRFLYLGARSTNVAGSRFAGTCSSCSAWRPRRILVARTSWPMSISRRARSPLPQRR